MTSLLSSRLERNNGLSSSQ